MGPYWSLGLSGTRRCSVLEARADPSAALLGGSSTVLARCPRSDWFEYRVATPPLHLQPEGSIIVRTVRHLRNPTGSEGVRPGSFGLLAARITYLDGGQGLSVSVHRFSRRPRATVGAFLDFGSNRFLGFFHVEEKVLFGCAGWMFLGMLKALFGRMS